MFRESAIPSDEKLLLRTERLILEPVTVQHAEELWRLFSDPVLHLFVEFEVPTLEAQTRRCERWARRRSPTGDELWLNWAARHAENGQVIGHFQAGVGEDRKATIGYLMCREHQGRGFAKEGLRRVFGFLRDELEVTCVRATIDTRNAASIRLAERLGLKQALTIGDDLIYEMPLYMQPGSIFDGGSAAGEQLPDGSAEGA